MDINQFAETVRNLMDMRGLTQKQLAEAAGVTEATISRYAGGKTQPEISIVARLAKVLGVSVDYLCGVTDLPAPRESLGEELVTLLRHYERTDWHDRKIIWSVLERRMTPNEQPPDFG